MPYQTSCYTMDIDETLVPKRYFIVIETRLSYLAWPLAWSSSPKWCRRSLSISIRETFLNLTRIGTCSVSATLEEHQAHTMFLFWSHPQHVGPESFGRICRIVDPSRESPGSRLRRNELIRRHHWASLSIVVSSVRYQTGFHLGDNLLWRQFPQSISR